MNQSTNQMIYPQACKPAKTKC